VERAKTPPGLAGAACPASPASEQGTEGVARMTVSGKIRVRREIPPAGGRLRIRQDDWPAASLEPPEAEPQGPPGSHGRRLCSNPA
jgi:hypothetical protein